jgi:hypothetical protein
MNEMVLQRRELLVARFEPVPEEELWSLADEMGIKGFVHAVMRNGDGEISYESLSKNMITALGDQTIAEWYAGTASPPGRVTGMRLGTNSAAAAKTGAGSFIGTYVSGSAVAITGGFPTSGPQAAARRIQWKGDWPAGTATSNGIVEAVLTNEAGPTNVAGVQGNTLARALIASADKGATDTLALTWSQDFQGAP